ncbi:MAG: GntR family transcriptional regulator [Planctomycetota bacterium]|nr:GntR family transcriptional regulator [Planctomycetota bacterium]
MPRGRRKRSPTYSEHVFAVLRDEIATGVYPPSTKLPSIRVLSARFHTSRFPVVQAVAQLAKERYVVRRHGSGNYVMDRPRALTLNDSVVICTRTEGHVYGELTSLLHRRLHDLGLLAFVIDMAHGKADELLLRSLHSRARYVVVHGGLGFPFHVLDPDLLREKELISALSWESEALLDRVHRVLVDHTAGSRILADHLWSAGHRHVLFAGPDDMILRAGRRDDQGECAPRTNVSGAGFCALWTRRSGSLTTFFARHERTGGGVDEQRLLKIMDAPVAPTAVVGLRDVDAWDVREALRHLRPELLARLAFVGNGDTPWSQMSHPPFSSLNWQLGCVADCVGAIIRRLQHGQKATKPYLHLIPPNLILR